MGDFAGSDRDGVTDVAMGMIAAVTVAGLSVRPDPRRRSGERTGRSGERTGRADERTREAIDNLLGAIMAQTA